MYRALPKDIARERKVLGALLESDASRGRRVRQRTTVMPADLPLCDLLNIPFASPVAKMVRRLVDARGNVLYAGVSWYRGDRFVSGPGLPRVRAQGGARHHRAAAAQPRRPQPRLTAVRPHPG